MESLPQPGARRVMVYGVTGSGKTTLAARLSEVTGLPWHSVDDLMWQPGWVETPLDEQVRQVSAICAGEEWILDTAYGKWREIPLARAELIVALDYPRWLSLVRLVRRTAVRVARRTPICNGNRESLRIAFSRDSIVLWHVRSLRRKHRRIAEWAAEPDGTPVLRFRRPRELDAWFASLSR